MNRVLLLVFAGILGVVLGIALISIIARRAKRFYEEIASSSASDTG